MELKEFISETLIQIIDGISLAQEHAIKKGALINPSNKAKSNRIYHDGSSRFYEPAEQTVEFDVAITASDSKEGKTGAGIFIAPISLGAQVKGESVNQTVSRIKFPVPLYMPEQKG